MTAAASFTKHLNKLIKEYLNSNCDFTTISAADIHEKLERILPPMMIEHNNGILLDSARMRAEFQRIAELVETAALAVVKQIPTQANFDRLQVKSISATTTMPIRRCAFKRKTA